MCRGMGHGSGHDTSCCRMNLGGPSIETCRKSQAAYTNKSGVHRNLVSSFQKLTLSKKLRVVPCGNDGTANDGTALKPALQFDTRTKKNIGLDFEAGVSFVKDNKEPSPEFLSNHIITEVLVSSVTSLDTCSSLPCAVDYGPKKGKTGDDMKSFFEHHCSLMQTCRYCQSLSSLNDTIVREECQTRYDSICTKCMDEGNVCSDCQREGQVNILPNLRACRPCLEAGSKCCKIAVHLTVDCKEGNNQAMISMNNIEIPHPHSAR